MSIDDKSEDVILKDVILKDNDDDDDDKGNTPTEQQIMDMQTRIGIRRSGDLIQIIKDLAIVRLQPKRNQILLGMDVDLYEMFGVEPSENL